MLSRTGPDIPDQLIGDSLRLRQVITNLVGDTIKFNTSSNLKASSEKGTS
jgi:osomolarity two-component system sensor histidine kinase NIK1